MIIEVYKSGCMVIIAKGMDELIRIYTHINKTVYNGKPIIDGLLEWNRAEFVFIDIIKKQAVISPFFKLDIKLINELLHTINFPANIITDVNIDEKTKSLEKSVLVLTKWDNPSYDNKTDRSIIEDRKHNFLRLSR